MAQDTNELRIPIRLLLSAHPALFEAIVSTPRRYRSERIRNLMEKGLIFEAQARQAPSPQNESESD